MELYKKNKRQACAEMLIEVENKMREVTLNAPTYKELRLIYMARELYIPKNLKGVSIEKINEVQQGFAKGINAYRDQEEVKEVLENLEQYMRELKIYNV